MIRHRPALRRGRGLDYWCPGCCRHVGASDKTDLDPETFERIELDYCKRCGSRDSREVNRRIQHVARR